MQSSCVSMSSCKQTKNCPHSHWSQLPPPHTAVNESMMGTHRGRSLWILTVWWWLQSPSAAGRWSDLPSQWSTPPHSWESKPSGSTRLPLQWGTRNRKSSTAPAACVFFTCLSTCSLRWKSSSSLSIIHMRIVFGVNVRLEVLVSHRRQNSRMLMLRHYPPPWTQHTDINPPNHIKRWLISMTTNYCHNQMIPCQCYLSSFSTHPFVRSSKRSLQIVWSNFSIGLEESGPRHSPGTMERSWGICWSAVSLAKLISFSQRSWMRRHMNV